MSTLALDEELVDLAGMLDDLCGKEVDDVLVHAVVDDPAAEVPRVVARLAEMGVPGLGVSEANGGSGAGALGLATAAEVLGRHLVPGPTLPTALAAYLLDRADGPADVLAALVDGTEYGAVALEPGSLVLDAATGRVSGTTAPVVTGVRARWLVLPVDADGTRRWVLVDTTDADASVHTSYDLTRRLVSYDLTDAPVRVLDLDADLPRLAAAVVLGAESVGTADWCTRTAAEYACTRVQFGRPIGTFQAVKHRIARMLIATEQARALAWDAARALDAATADPALREEAELVAAAAGATCVDAGFAAAKDLINTLGGIGFTWEHRAGFHLRRAQTSRVVLGASESWQARVGALALAGVDRSVVPDLPEAAGAIRTTVRAELDEALALPEADRTAFLAERGYTLPTLPPPWGKGADALTQVVIGQELAATGLVPHDMIVGNWVAPSLTAFGDASQQERFVGPSLRGDIRWCQLFSEPGAGSDLAALSTRATRTDGGWLVNGQKVWTSGARESGWGILLARTDPDAPRHRGIGYFLLDMTTPGITIRPLRELTGDALFNEVFLDDVFVPDGRLVAGPTDGWKVAMTTLANERVHMAGGSAFGHGEGLLLATVRSRRPDDPVAHVRVGALLARSLSASLLGLRSLLKSLAGGQPGAESSVAKLVSTLTSQDVWEAAVAEAGTDALRRDHAAEVRSHEELAGDPVHMFLNSRSATIAGGTTDVQLNIVAERILGLPRD